MKYFYILFTLLASCSGPHLHSPRATPIFSPTSIFDNCKFVGTASTALVSVAFFNNCGPQKNTLFGVMVYESESMDLAGIDAAQIIKYKLGYSPKLALVTNIMISDKHGLVYPFMIFVDVTLNKKSVFK